MSGRGGFRVGTSGWQYDDWKGLFYPEDLPKDRWFSYYAEHFDTVEVNNTFYHLPSQDAFDAWREQAPAGFLYTLKFSRYGTQMKKLKDPEEVIRNFMQRAERLKSFLGPILVQLPPHWKSNPGRLAAFLEAAPAAVRWAVEFRDSSWLNDEVFAVLRNRGAALVIHDLIADHPKIATSDWVYLRFHGVDYSHDYSPQALASTADLIRDFLDDGLDVYAYFNNDYHGYALHNARDLRRYVEARS
jgi:uncharacterized protein YecE (DUF72 family)